MATATVLHVGDDLCHRIPVMELAGLTVLRTECSVAALEDLFAEGKTFSGIAFHNEIATPLPPLVSTARTFSNAPLVLFQNSLLECDEYLFDLVIPVHTPPTAWLKSLEEAIREGRNLRAESQQLREDCANVRSISRELQRTSSRNRESPIDCDALWGNNPEK